MSDDQARKLAKTVDAVLSSCGPKLRELADNQGHTHEGIVYGLMLLAANHAHHDGATLENLLLALNAAWDFTTREHATGNADSTERSDDD